MAVDQSQLAGHVKDAHGFHLPNGTAEGYHLHIPQPVEIAGWMGVEDPPAWVQGMELTKYMVLEVVAAVLMIVIFVPLAWRVSRGKPPQGKLWNLFEAMLLFIRNDVVRPAIGGKEADRFLPLIWTIFFFILFCNLLGMVPWAGSPTGAWGMTAAMAGITFCTVVGTGMKKHGLMGYWTGQVPHMELPLVMAVVIKPMVLVIEVMGLLIKHFVLSVRLLINMFAGHLVLAVLLGFITMTADQGILWYAVTPISILGTVALSLLELFVAFLQAYIFTFLSALFIGMAIHQH